MKRASLMLAAAIAAFTSASASAQTYPNQPIRIVVPFAAGGAVDIVARVVGQKMSESLGQPVVIENKPGAGGNLAADTVARAAPDGYTMLLTTNGHAISPSLYSTLPFDAVKDFIPVTQLIESAAAAGCVQQARSQFAQGSDRAGEAEAGRAELWVDRNRQSASSVDGDAQDPNRHRHRQCAVQGRCAA